MNPRPPHGRRWARWLALFGMVVAEPRDLLELDARRRIFEHVQRFPGLHLREVARAAGLEMNHVKYHLQYMEKHGLISSRRDEGFWRFYPREEGSIGWRDQLPVEAKRMLALLRRPVPLHIALVLLDQGALNQTQLQQLVGLSASTLHYHLNRAEREGLLVSERQGRERVFRLADPHETAQLLVRYRPPPSLVADFLDAWELLDL